MKAAAFPEAGRLGARLIAPRWHALAVLLIILAFSVLGVIGAHVRGAAAHGERQGLAAGYVLVIALEWVLVAFVWLGTRRRNVAPSEILGGRWSNWQEVMRDMGIAALFLIASNIASAILTQIIKVDPARAMREILPHGGAEAALFLPLVLTAGICEEIIFRGYLQKQLAAMTGNAGVGIAVQGILFAVFHGNQGWRFMVIIAVDGWLLGALAFWRRSIRPGMIAHCVQDGAVGLLAPYLFR